MSTLDSPTPPHPHTPTPSPKLGRLLVVDDEVELMGALCEMLREQGYETAGFTSGKEAVTALQEQDFDLVLADLMMPEMDGISVLRAGLDIDPHLVGIIMTGQGTEPTAVEAMKVGAFDYVLKPFKLHALLPILSRAMGVRRLRLENVQLRETMAIYELSMAAAFSLDANTILSKVAEGALQQCQANEVSIMLPTPDGTELYVAVVRGERPRPILGERMPIDRGIAGWVARQQEPLRLQGEVTDARFGPIYPRPEIRAALSMPMLVGGKLVGVLNVNATDRRRGFRLGQVKALNILATIAATALENAQLYRQVREREETLHALYQAGLEIQKPLELQTRLDRLLQTSRDVLHPDRLSILLADPEGQWLQAVASLGTEDPLEAIRVPIGPEGGGLARAYLTQQAIFWDGRAPVPEDLRLKPPYDGIKALRSRVFANVPLVVQGRAIGVLAVDRKHSRQPLDAATLELLQLFAIQASLAIESARLYADLEARIKALTRRTQELEALNTIGRAVSSSLAPAEVLDQALEATLSALDVEAGEIFLLEEARGEVVLARHRGLIPEAFSEVTCFKVGEGFPGRVVQTGEVLVTTDLAKDTCFLRKRVIEAGFCSFAAVPLKAKGKVVGTLNVASRSSDAFTGERLHLLTTIGNGVGMAVANAGLYEELRMAAKHLEARVEDRTRELEAANRQLQEASRHKSEFLANMSHELRTPLNSIIGFAELVAEQRVGPLTEKQARYLGHIHNSGKHLLQIIYDILDLSKVEAGKFVLRPEPLPVAQTLKDILVILRGLATKKGQTLEAQVEPELPLLQADPVRLKQVLFNLLSNAVKFTPENGTVRVTARRVDWSKSQMVDSSGPVDQLTTRPVDAPGVWLEIRVTDTGIGIKAEDLPRLFREFVQLETTQAHHQEGTGLGLALIKKLVELHGGRIWAASEGEGQGATFTVLLPFAGPGT